MNNDREGQVTGVELDRTTGGNEQSGNGYRSSALTLAGLVTLAGAAATGIWLGYKGVKDSGIIEEMFRQLENFYTNPQYF